MSGRRTILYDVTVEDPRVLVEPWVLLTRVVAARHKC